MFTITIKAYCTIVPNDKYYLPLSVKYAYNGIPNSQIGFVVLKKIPLVVLVSIPFFGYSAYFRQRSTSQIFQNNFEMLMDGLQLIPQYLFIYIFSL